MTDNVARKRTAAGLFHFNIRYIAGDSDFYIRYATEIVERFLDVLEANPAFRTSIHLCGADIEYLAEHNPETLERLRALVNVDRVELLSAMYSNAIWVAFPQRDLLRSVQINRRVLEQHELIASNVFFSQEAFFGMGLRHLSKYFSRAVCKDDYLRPVSNLDEIEQAYRLDGMGVVVGGGHILNQISELVVTDRNSATLLMYKRKLDEVRKSNLPNSRFTNDGVYWYHLGSAHHLVTAGFPHRRETFFSDGDWISIVEEQLQTIGSECDFSFIRDLEYELTSLPDLPQVPEGAWNYRGSQGVRRWMGWHTAEWERDAIVLASAWQTRSALLRYECEEAGQDQSGSELSDALVRFWKKQLLVEGSDALGWQPRKVEVESSLLEAERLLVEITNSTRKRNWRGPFLQNVRAIVAQVGSRGALPYITSEIPEAIGNATVDGWAEIASGVYLLRVELRVAGGRTGVRIKRSSDVIIYCRSGDEQSAATIRNQNRSGPTFLPISNGLLSIGENDFVIQVNRYGQVAAEIELGNGAVEFTVEGPGGKRNQMLVYLRYHGVLDAAITFANLINEV
jgi:hypothetical protein